MITRAAAPVLLLSSLGLLSAPMFDILLRSPAPSRTAGATRSTVMSHAANSSPWPKFQADEQNSGRSPAHVGPGRHLWTFTDPGRPAGPAALSDDGVLYCGSWFGTAYAIVAATGHLKWKIDTHEEAVWFATIASPAVVIYGTFSAVYALNRSDGSVVWLKRGFSSHGCVVDRLGVAYAACSDNRVRALDIQDGSTRWEYVTGRPAIFVPAIYHGTHLIVTCIDGTVVSLSCATGQRQWSFRAGSLAETAPVITDDGKVLFGTEDGHLFCLDAVTGKRLWRFATGDEVDAAPAIDGSGNVFFGARNGDMYSLRTNRGAKNWIFHTGGAIDGSTVVCSDDSICFGSADGHLYCLDARIGKPRWVFDGGDVINDSLVVANDGTIFFSIADGRIMAVR